MSDQKNEEKNEKKPYEIVRAENLSKGKKFSADNQPTPEAKSKGWEKRRMALAFMNDVVKFMNMTENELYKLNRQDMTRGELMALKYVLGSIEDPKLLMHFIDKHIPTSKTLDITSDGEKITGYTFEIIDKTEDIDDQEDPDNSSIQEAS